MGRFQIDWTFLGAFIAGWLGRVRLASLGFSDSDSISRFSTSSHARISGFWMISGVEPGWQSCFRYARASSVVPFGSGLSMLVILALGCTNENSTFGQF